MKRWTEEQKELLETYYGKIDTDRLCKRLGVTYSQFRRKAKTMGLGYQRESDEFITARQIRSILGVQHYTIQRFIKAGLPVTYKRFGKKTNVMIRLSDLLDWLENHQDIWSAIKVEHLAFGIEPQWLRNKRQREYDEKHFKNIKTN